jgi:anti-sigma factor RsiW
MGNLLQRENENCERFRDALDALPLGESPRRSAGEWRAELPEAEARHGAECAACLTALEEFAETRNLVAGMPLAQPGPWFTARVMAAINSREREEESRDGVWISVRRLAPRMVVFSALLLILGGSWAVQQQSNDTATVDRRTGDVVFDSPVAPTWYDDGLSTMNEVRP